MNSMIKYRLLSLSDKEAWEAFLLRFPQDQQEIYYSPYYYELYESIGDGKAQCFVYEDNNDLAIYPFLINSVNKLGYILNGEFSDIQGAYGYNGILTSNDSKFFLDSFFECFDNFCVDNNIIAEFLRVNPLTNNPLIHRNDFLLIHDQENIFVNLLNSDIFETAFEYSTRKNIRKAIKSGLTYKYVLGDDIRDLDLKSFRDIYNHTMERNNVNQYYFFDEKFFNGIAKRLNQKALFAFVMFENQIISCEIVLLGGKTAYSFLGGTLSDYYQYRPNDFLKYNTILVLKEIGYHNYLLGGGPEGVLRYKRSFSKDGEVPFFIGKRIHNQEIYNEVVRQWEKRNPDKVELYKNFVLKYRY